MLSWSSLSSCSSLAASDALGAEDGETISEEDERAAAPAPYPRRAAVFVALSGYRLARAAAARATVPPALARVTPPRCDAFGCGRGAAVVPCPGGCAATYCSLDCGAAASGAAAHRCAEELGPAAARAEAAVRAAAYAHAAELAARRGPPQPRG